MFPRLAGTARTPRGLSPCVRGRMGSESALWANGTGLWRRMPPKQYADVESFLSDLSPNARPIVDAIRATMLEISPKISDGIKWNCLSFRTVEWFGTVNVRAQRGKPVALLILHAGAKVRSTETPGIAVADPDGLLVWLGRDRASIGFADLEDWSRKRPAFIAVIREWVAMLA